MRFSLYWVLKLYPKCCIVVQNWVYTMNQPEKLDKIIIEDRLNLGSEEILDRVLHIANERAQLYGWQSFELRALDDKTIIEDGLSRFEFDVWGLSGERSNVEPTQDNLPEKSGGEEKYVASPFKGVDL